MEAPEIRSAEGTETERVASCLTLAFASDPTMRWLWPDGESYLRNFPRLVRSFGGRAFDHGTADAAAGFGGAALWLPEGVAPDGERMEELFEETTTGSHRDDAFAVLAQMDELHTHERHHHLAFIGVDASRQGQGLGSFVLGRGIERCDAAGVAAYLESSNPVNVPFYQRHGFEIVGEIQAGSSPTIHGMIRPAR